MTTAYGEQLEKLQQASRFRRMLPLSERNGSQVILDNCQMLNLSSNDYLGLATDRAFHRRFYAQCNEHNIVEEYGLGAASSRLLTGDSVELQSFERELAESYGSEAALYFNSGYHANIGILPALLTKQDLILSDKLNHASIHDGMRLCYATHKRYRHGDYDHLEELLTQLRPQHGRVVIVSESLFSMDGDIADLRRLVELKNTFDCLLYIDEAHAIGVFGEKGLGLAEEQGVLSDIDLLLCPVGKAFASMGAYLICSRELYNYLVNHSRSLIFTTALPPVVVHWCRFVFHALAEMTEKRRYLREISTALRQNFNSRGLRTAGESQIIPVIVGSDSHATRGAELLQQKGFLVLPVRPPTVPEGTARFRLSLTAAIGWSELEHLATDIINCLSEAEGMA